MVCIPGGDDNNYYRHGANSGVHAPAFLTPWRVIRCYHASYHGGGGRRRLWCSLCKQYTAATTAAAGSRSVTFGGSDGGGGGGENETQLTSATTLRFFFFIIIIIIIARYHVGRDHYYCYASDRDVIVVMWATRAHGTTAVPVRHVNYRSSFSARAAVQHPVIAFMTGTRSPGSQPDIVSSCLRRVRGPRLPFPSRRAGETKKRPNYTNRRGAAVCRLSSSSPTIHDGSDVLNRVVSTVPATYRRQLDRPCGKRTPQSVKTTHYCCFADSERGLCLAPFPCSRRYHYRSILFESIILLFC